MMLNIKKEEERTYFVRSKLAYHTSGKYQNKENIHNPKADRTPSSSHIDMEKSIRIIMEESDLHQRIQLFKDLSGVVHKASVPYIEFLINKYTKKLYQEIV